MTSFFRNRAIRSLRLLQRLGMARQWLLAYVVFIVIPASLILYSYYHKTASILEDEVTRTMQQTLEQASINLSSRLVHIEDISNSVFMNPKLHEYLQGNGDESAGLKLETMKNLSELVDTVQTNFNIFRVRLFVDSSKLVAGERINFFPVDDLKNKSWYDRVIQANGGIVWTGIYPETYIDRGEAYVFSSSRLLRNPKSYDEISGVLVIDIPENLITDILQKIDISPNTDVFLLDKDNVTTASIDKAQLGIRRSFSEEAAAALSSTPEGITKFTTGDNVNRYLVYTQVGSTPWKLVADVPASEISQRVLKQNQFSLLMTILIVAAAFFILMFILLALMIRNMNRRVHKMIRVIEKEGIERLEVKGAAGGDFNVLQLFVDQLIHKMKSLMEQAYRAQVLEREAQLRALQAQINPHFLYNTLDTINWIAIGRGAHDISLMIDGLAKYFRLSLSKGRDMVSVTDELSLAQVYLNIQQTRFPHSFQYSIEAGPDLHRYVMPKLTLQPIVENALLHGIRKSKAKSGTIDIHAYKEGDELIIVVTDNGIGIEEQTLRNLLTEAPSRARGDGSGSSYGLYNVHERIQLFSGEAYGLRIQSHPGAGTTVTVRMAAREQEL